MCHTILAVYYSLVDKEDYLSGLQTLSSLQSLDHRGLGSSGSAAEGITSEEGITAEEGII